MQAVIILLLRHATLIWAYQEYCQELFHIFFHLPVFWINSDDALPKEDIYIRYREYVKSMPGDIIICKKDELMRKIINHYSGVTAKKLRRASIENADDIKPRQCLTGLKWKTHSN